MKKYYNCPKCSAWISTTFPAGDTVTCPRCGRISSVPEDTISEDQAKRIAADARKKDGPAAKQPKQPRRTRPPRVRAEAGDDPAKRYSHAMVLSRIGSGVGRIMLWGGLALVVLSYPIGSFITHMWDPHTVLAVAAPYAVAGGCLAAAGLLFCIGSQLLGVAVDIARNTSQLSDQGKTQRDGGSGGARS